jgi:acid phosphatase (class A)
MEPIYQFSTPKSIAQLKEEQENLQAKETQPQPCTNCSNKDNAKTGIKPATALAIALLLLSGLFANTTAVAQHAMAYKHISPPAASNAAPEKSLDEISFPEAEFRRGAYLKMRTVYLQVPVSKFKIKPFPANSSAETRAELDFLLHLQQNRSAESVNRSETMATIYFDPLTTNPSDPDYSRNVSSLFYIGQKLGPWFNASQLPVTNQVLQHVMQDATYYFFSLKADFNRARPYHLEPRLQNLEAPGHAAYPSGHASASYVHAYILGHIFPEYAAYFEGVASEMAFSREVRGVHYPSDSEAGKEFARQFVKALMNNGKFQKDFTAMKAEIQQVRAFNQLSRK